MLTAVMWSFHFFRPFIRLHDKFKQLTDALNFRQKAATGFAENRGPENGGPQPLNDSNITIK